MTKKCECKETHVSCPYESEYTCVDCKAEICPICTFLPGKAHGTTVRPFSIKEVICVPCARLREAKGPR